MWDGFIPNPFRVHAMGYYGNGVFGGASMGKWVGKKGCFYGEKGVEFHFCG